MSDGDTKQLISSLLTEIQELRSEVRDLKQHVAAPRSAEGEVIGLRQDIKRVEDLLYESQAQIVEEAPAAVFQLNVFLETNDSERKPFQLKTDGILASSSKLSSVRAAISFILFLDLQDRYENGKGVVDRVEAITKAYVTLEPRADSEKDVSNTIRVALYRFEQFCQDQKSFGSSEFKLWYDAENIRFELIDQRTQKRAESIALQVTTLNPVISSVLDQIFTDSAIARARKRKAIYVPSGPEGADHFLLEMYDHAYPLKVTSLYVRPPFPSYPTNLLEFMGVSEKVIQRKRLAFEGYKTKRFRFVEVLSEQTIWDLIRYSPEFGFKLYPKNVVAEQVLEHIDNLIYILNTYENYSFYLTGVSVPFALVTYEIRSGAVPECFTVFFQAFTSAAKRDLGCFVLYGNLVGQRIKENIIDWLVTHPTTIRDRKEVIAILRKVRNHLADQGPLPYR